MNNIISGIYKIICEANNKFYIGSSQNINARIKCHFKQLRQNKHHNPHMQSAFNQYGESSFKYEIVEICNINILLEREQNWMDNTQCYNREIGFNNCIKSDRPLGYKHTVENKQLMSDLKKGSKLSQDHINKIAASNSGKKRTDEQKEKMSKAKIGEKNPMFGRVESDEHKEKRMKNMLNTPRWNKGLTKKDDPRLEKLAVWKGKTARNTIKCKLINLITGEIYEAESLKKLSEISPISLSAINRIKNNTCSNKIKNTYKLEYEGGIN
jgi:group I intron endonuclease